MVSRIAVALLTFCLLGAPGVSGAAHDACPPHCAHAAQADAGCGAGEEHCPSPSLAAQPCCTAAPLAPGTASERASAGSLQPHAGFAARAAGFAPAGAVALAQHPDVCAASAAVRRSVVLRL